MAITVAGRVKSRQGIALAHGQRQRLGKNVSLLGGRFRRLDATSNERPFKTRNESTLHSLRTRAEIEAIRRALQQTSWNRKQAANLLESATRRLFYKAEKARA